jgi:hypothetical protein
MEKEKKAEEQNLEPELEYDIARSHTQNETDRKEKGVKIIIINNNTIFHCG